MVFCGFDFERRNINFYLDSSNFLTYSSLSSAKADVAKRALQNITKDILEELEYEKEKSEKVIEEIRALFDKVQKEADSIQNQIKDMKIDLNFSDIEESISCLKSSVKRQKNSLDEIKNNLNQMSSLVSTIGTSGETEEIKKQTVIAGLTEIIDGINESKQDIEESLDGINKIDVSGVLNKNYTKEINKKVDNIEKIFVEAESKAGDIEINLGKLKSKFLSEPISLETTATNGEIRYFDYLGAGVLSLIVFFICIMTPALNIVSEKEKNTLYRLSTTPASSVQIFIGKFFTFLVFGFIEMIYTLFLAIIIYDLRITGNIYHVIVVLTLLACASISVGLFISSKVKTMQQTLILIPLIIIPSFLISHAFFPPDIMADFMNKVAYVTPMTFSNHALNAIMIKGHSLNQLTLDLSILAIFTLVPLVFFIRSYKRMKY